MEKGERKLCCQGAKTASNGTQRSHPRPLAGAEVASVHPETASKTADAANTKLHLQESTGRYRPTSANAEQQVTEPMPRHMAGRLLLHTCMSMLPEAGAGWQPGGSQGDLSPHLCPDIFSLPPLLPKFFLLNYSNWDEILVGNRQHLQQESWAYQSRG